jgi:hypothetical protein
VGLPGETPYVFVTERKGPLTDSSVRKLVARVGQVAKLGFPVHPHMLRHACGYKLANEGNIPGRFSITWGIGTFSTLYGIPSWRRIGLAGSGRIDNCMITSHS